MTGSRHLAGAIEIEAWADRVESRTDFPRLARRLIQQTNDQVSVLEMRAGEGAGMPGYDGRVRASRATPFVPLGDSVWELGVGSEPQDKANSDYKLRTEDSLGVDMSQTTFVFVTARRWANKNAWAARKRGDKKWADVVAFDADDIETAFEVAPAVQYWFSELIGLPADGIRTIENWWDAFSRSSLPNLTPELVLAGRADAAAQLLDLLEQDTRITTVSASGQDDVLAFVAASLLARAEPKRSDLMSRTLIVHDAASLRRLDATTDLLVLLPFNDELRREAKLVRSHHVILIAPESAPADVQVPDIDRDSFAAALMVEGVDEGTATSLARAAHRSLVAFQAEAPASGARLRGWHSVFESAIVRRAWLAGGWTEARSGDTDALATLFGTDYDSARALLRPAAASEDPVFAVVGGTWALTSPDQAWNYARPHLTASDLMSAEVLIQTVLGAVDPALELPLDERWMAGIHGKTRIHSSDLRRGLATSLAACGAFGQDETVGGLGTPADWASSVVARLLRRANESDDGNLWASLSDVLPLLAEAAPDAFLRAVREGVTPRSEPVLTSMFADSERADTFAVSSPHTGLLWALETLAWSEEYAPLAIQLLARLAELDPGGRLSNRPGNTLSNIFRTWLPQTSLPASRRLAVLDALRRDHPDVAWPLMLTLLPEAHAVGSYTHAPRFRAWKPTEATVTRAEYLEVGSEVAKRVLEDAPEVPERWLEIVARLPDFPEPERATAIRFLKQLGTAGSLPTGQRDRVWHEVSKLVRTHRTYSDAEWSLPEDVLAEVEEVADAFAPSDPRDASRWLFDEHFPEFGGARLEYDAEEQRLREARVQAVTAVFATAGFEGLRDFARTVEYPGLVGNATAELASGEVDRQIVELVDSDAVAVTTFAYAYVSQRLRTEGATWLEDQLLVMADRPVAQARLLLASTDLPMAWRRATELGADVELAYWQEFTPYGRGADFQLANEAARALLDHGRVLAALDLMNLYVRKEDRRVSAALITESLEQMVALPEPHHEERRLTDYAVDSLLDYVRGSDVDEERLAVLEWQLLPALGYDAHSPLLERKLARDPAFFVEVVSMIYKPRGEEPTEQTPAHVAQNAWRLLNRWQIVPGSTEPGAQVDGEALARWTDDARELLAQANRREVGDLTIGHVLSHARADDDGSWPTRPVRDLIERVASPNLEDGFRTQIYNNRGVTSRGLTDGGAQERALTEKYSELAALIKDGWPRTATVLRELARGYEREARGHDEEAERFREGMDR